MPLFKCSKCGCVENTALTPKSWGEPPDKMECSECAIGKWHGCFPKKQADDEYKVKNPECKRKFLTQK